MAVDNPKANNGRGEEEDGSQEGESNVSLEFGALGLPSDAVPVPDGAAVHGANVVGEKGKGNDVEDEEDEIGGPVQEAAGEWEEEDQGEENAECGNDLSVDKALLRPC